MVAKANKLLGLIMRSFKYMDPESMIVFYKSQVRSLLEYGHLIWCPKFH
jgi:hypothetical protein